MGLQPEVLPSPTSNLTVIQQETRKSCSCETAVRMLKSSIGIADHAKKAEHSENLAECY